MSSTEPTNTDPGNTDPGNGEPADGDLKPHERQFKTERDEARGERDTAQSTVTRLLTREVERVAGEHLSVGTDWTLEGATLEDVLNDDGDVDPDKVKAVADAIIAKRPGMEKPRGNSRHGAGGNGNPPTEAPGPKSYHEQFQTDHSAGKRATRAWNEK